MANFCYVKAHETLINLDNAVSIANENGSGVTVTMPDGKQYQIAMPMDEIIQFLNVPFMGNKVCVAINSEELKKQQGPEKLKLVDILKRQE